MKKLQVAVEYLLTYGFALFVVLVVLGMLFYIVGGYLSQQSQCVVSGNPNFQCSKPAEIIIGNDNVTRANIYLSYRFGQWNIQITKATCVASTSSSYDPSWKEYREKKELELISPGKDFVVTNITCKNEEGKPLTTLKDQQMFKGWIVLWYKIEGQGIERPLAVQVIERAIKE